VLLAATGKAIILCDPLLVAIDDAGDFFREGRRFRSQPERLVVTHFVIRHADKDRACNQQKQRDYASNSRNLCSQIDCGDASFSRYCLHLCW